MLNEDDKKGEQVHEEGELVNKDKKQHKIIHKNLGHIELYKTNDILGIKDCFFRNFSDEEIKKNFHGKRFKEDQAKQSFFKLNKDLAEEEKKFKLKEEEFPLFIELHWKDPKLKKDLGINNKIYFSKKFCDDIEYFFTKLDKKKVGQKEEIWLSEFASIIYNNKVFIDKDDNIYLNHVNYI